MMNKKLPFLFAAMLFCMTAQATDYFVAELSGTTLTFKKTTTAPDNTTSWDATNTGEETPGWNSNTYTTVIFDASFADARPTSCYFWFAYDYYADNLITSITGLEYLNTSDVTNMCGMFSECGSLTSLDLSSFNTSNVIDMASMFSYCENLVSLNLSSFDVRKVLFMENMFQGCESLSSLDLSSFETSEAPLMSSMFFGCSSLTSLDLSNIHAHWNVDDLSYGDDIYGDLVGYMFQGCSSLIWLDISSFETSDLTNMDYMFTDCRNLQTIVVGEGWNTSNVTRCQDMFLRCYSIVGKNGFHYVGSDVSDGFFDYTTCYASTDYYLTPSIALFDDANNSSIISSYNGNKAKVTLADRTLYQDNKWNTICLPFDVDLTDTNSPLYGATVKELDTEAGRYDHVTGFENGTLYLNFKDVTTTMTAGTPYIIKWASGDDLVNPSFLPVNINNTMNNVTSSDGRVTFTGTYAPVSITSSEGDNTKLYLGSDNTLFYPNAEMTIGCQRAYFQLTGITAEEVTNARLFFGDETLAIHNVQRIMPNEAGACYTINGMKLGGQPTRAGLYIRNGHKVVVH